MEQAIMTAGRPTDYSNELADVVCSRLSSGESMRAISRDESMPCMTSLFKWLREIPEFAQQYVKAKEEAADAFVEDMLDIADNQVEQPLLVDGVPLQIDGKMVMIKDMVSVNHAKLRVDTRKWAASKLKPKKYGERVAVALNTKELSDMDEEELDRLILERQRAAQQSAED